MNEIFYSLTGAKWVADLVQAGLAASELRLFKDTLTPTPSTPLADFDTNEADYTGYTTGGETITAWLDPVLSPQGGYQISSPLVQFVVGTPVVAGNAIGGWYLVDSGGDLIAYGTFGSPQPMEEADQGIEISVTLVFPTTQ